jgi:glyoxylase-like metal-dependent hydrolase (beta-lactamase superfamily II)
MDKGRTIKIEAGAPMREVIENVFSWSWFSEPHGYDFNGHLIRHPGGNLCIDPVEPGEAVLDAIGGLGVATILLTNRNHSRAANAVRSRSGAKTVIHPDDAAHARDQGTELDGELLVGDRIGPLVVIGAPGKSPGEVALHWPARRVLVVGDAVIGNPPGRCGLLREAVMDDPAMLRESVAKLLELDFETLLVGDGEPILEGAKQKLQELVESFPK